MLKCVCNRTLLNYGIQCCLQETSTRLASLPILFNKSTSRYCFLTRVRTFRHLHLTASSFKLKKGDKNKGKPVLNSVNNEFLRRTVREMDDLEKMLEDELAKHFSLQFDIRQYEDLPVALDNEEVIPLGKLGRVSLLNSNTVLVNFAENPTVLKTAKLALETSTLRVNPQQDGLSLFIPIPKLSRERREHLADSARKILYNDYKNALNNVFTSHGEKVDRNIKDEDEKRKTQAALLALKRNREAKGLEKIEAARAVLLKEIA